MVTFNLLPKFNLKWKLLNPDISFLTHIFFHWSHSLHLLDLRQNGIGIGSMCARMGGVLAPMLHFLRGVSPLAPMVLCGLCPLLGSALTLLLPETANKHLPDTVEDVEGPDLRCGSALCPAPFIYPLIRLCLQHILHLLLTLETLLKASSVSCSEEDGGVKLSPAVIVASPQ